MNYNNLGNTPIVQQKYIPFFIALLLVVVFGGLLLADYLTKH